ncbi:hypothetical protein [Chroococcidiopsis sp.]|uniref:hypothetical protein n=1 Tax=Chroococcidiopsis sp. TaxID=3088168 RepID=UPI003F3C83DE
MDNVSKEQITRMTLESIARVRIALVKAVEEGAQAMAMEQYVRAIDNLEDALDYFTPDDDEDDNKPLPYSPQPDLSAKEFDNLRKAAVDHIFRIHIGLGGK